MIPGARARDPRGCYPAVTTGNSQKWRETAICYHVTSVTSRPYSYVRAGLSSLFTGNKSNKVTNRSRARVWAVTFLSRNGNGGNSLSATPLPALVLALHLRAVAANPAPQSWLWAAAAALVALHWRRP